MTDLEKQNHVTLILEEQRNNLLNQTVLLNVRIKELEEENKKLEEENKLLSDTLAEREIEVQGPTIA